MCGGCEFGDICDSLLPRECPMPVRSPPLTTLIALGALFLLTPDAARTQLRADMAKPHVSIIRKCADPGADMREKMEALKKWDPALL
jgi:hypothetical protein